MSDLNYYKNDAISYSMLRAISVGPSYYQSLQKKEQDITESFLIGSAVDCLITEYDKFWEKYALEYKEVCEKVPTGQMKEYCEELLSLTILETDEPERGAYNNVGFKQASFDKVLERFKKEGEEYYKWLQNKVKYNESIENKQLISNSQYETITKIVESLKTNRFTRKYFEGTIGKNIEIKHQVEIYWEFKGNKCKSKLDLVIIDHDNKEVHPIDLKTTGNSPFSFDSSSLKYRYDIQSSFYSSALYWLINKSNDEYWTKFKDYTIKPFKFIVESTKYQGLPLIYECSEKFLEGGIDGFTHQNRWYKGFIELINEYNWYKENNSWDYPKDIIEKEGIIELNYD